MEARVDNKSELAQAETTEAQIDEARLDNFSCIVERYQSLVWGIAYVITGNASTSEDLAQETFLAAWRQQADIRDLSKMRSYLAGIVRNLASTARYKMAREIVDGDIASDAITQNPNALDGLLSGEQTFQVTRALEQIPSASREPFVLFYLQNKSISRVSADLEISESAVKQRLYRARESLKENIATQLAHSVLTNRPGKAFAIVTMAAIIGQSTPALAATAATTNIASQAAAAAVAKPAALAKPLAAKSTQSSTSLLSMLTGLALGTKLALLGGAIAMMLTFYVLIDAADASSQSQVVATSDAENAIESQPPALAPEEREVPSLEIEEEEEEGPKVEGLADQPLVVGRILIENRSADTDGDGKLSEEEVEEFRIAQEQKMIDSIAQHWRDTGMNIFCKNVGFGDKGVNEYYYNYSVDVIRTEYLQEKETGLNLSVKEWIESYLINNSSEREVCYHIYAQYFDQLRQLRFMEKQKMKIRWMISFRTSTGYFLSSFAPKIILDELNTMTREEGLAEIANYWGVNIQASSRKGPEFHFYANPREAKTFEELDPIVQKALNSEDEILEKDDSDPTDN